MTIYDTMRGALHAGLFHLGYKDKEERAKILPSITRGKIDVGEPHTEPITYYRLRNPDGIEAAFAIGRLPEGAGYDLWMIDPIDGSPFRT